MDGKEPETMNIYTVYSWIGELLEISANLFIMGIPIMEVMALDRCRKTWHGGRYYCLAFALVVAWERLAVQCRPGPHYGPKAGTARVG